VVVDDASTDITRSIIVEGQNDRGQPFGEPLSGDDILNELIIKPTPETPFGSLWRLIFRDLARRVLNLYLMVSPYARATIFLPTYRYF